MVEASGDHDRRDQFDWPDGPRLVFSADGSAVVATYARTERAVIEGNGTGLVLRTVNNRPAVRLPWNGLVPGNLIDIAISRVFRNGAVLHLLGDRLEIRSGEGDILSFSLQMSEPSGSIEGAWELSSYLSKTTPAGFGNTRHPVSVTFSRSGQLTIEGFINTGFGHYSVKGRDLAVSGMSWTLVGGPKTLLAGDT
jgi:heat shock protein HslJ